MKNEFWINLASKDLIKSREFYTRLGFEMNDKHASADMVSMYLGNKKVVLNLFPAAVFEGFSQASVNDTANSAEVLFSLGADSRGEVDAMAKKAVDAGGILYGKPGEKAGWMYGCGFIDPDGHRWNVLFMDMNKMPGR
jgi:uncharacterized protein